MKINVEKLNIKELDNFENGTSLMGSITYELTNECLKAQSKIEDKVLEEWKIRKEDVLEALKYKERCKLAIEFIKEHQRKEEFLELNEWQTRNLLEILKDSDD